jgi:hypothetical protein
MPRAGRAGEHTATRVGRYCLHAILTLLKDSAVPPTIQKKAPLPRHVIGRLTRALAAQGFVPEDLASVEGREAIEAVSRAGLAAPKFENDVARRHWRTHWQAVIDAAVQQWKKL